VVDGRRFPLRIGRPIHPNRLPRPIAQKPDESITLDNHSPQTAIRSPLTPMDKNQTEYTTSYLEDSYGFRYERHVLCQVRWKRPGCLSS
jgi:hypothetical protein